MGIRNPAVWSNGRLSACQSKRRQFQSDWNQFPSSLSKGDLSLTPIISLEAKMIVKLTFIHTSFKREIPLFFDKNNKLLLYIYYYYYKRLTSRLTRTQSMKDHTLITALRQCSTISSCQTPPLISIASIIFDQTKLFHVNLHTGRYLGGGNLEFNPPP